MVDSFFGFDLLMFCLFFPSYLYAIFSFFDLWQIGICCSVAPVILF